MDEKTIARVYLTQQAGDRAVVTIGGTSYQLHLVSTGPLKPSPQGRVRGVIRCPVWKVDFVSAGGAFIDPVIGRPRRIHGHVIAADPATNSIVVSVAGTPIVGDMPPRWNAEHFPLGMRVALDVKEGSTFEPVAAAAAL